MTIVQSADGTSIGYSTTGRGPALVLVDGALCSRSFGPMPKLAERLAPHFTVYTYDRRGRGESGDTPPYAVEREVEDLEAVTAAAGGDVFLHGTSSGAVLALEAAKRIRVDYDVYEPVTDAREPIAIDQAALRAAVRHRQKVRFVYRDMRDRLTERTVRPLITAFYGNAWLLAAWCEDKEDFRVFRQDRMSKMTILSETFQREPGRTAEDFLAQDAGPGGKK